MKRKNSLGRILALLLTVVLLGSLLSACGGSSGSGSSGSGSSGQSTSGKNDSGSGSGSGKNDKDSKDDKNDKNDKGGDLDLFDVHNNINDLIANGGLEFSYTATDASGETETGTNGALGTAFWMVYDDESLGFDKLAEDDYVMFEINEEGKWEYYWDTEEYEYNSYFNYWSPSLTPYIGAETFKKAGSDKVAGRSCTKYDVVYKHAGEEVKGSAWFDNETGFLMKADDTEGTWEVTSFKTGITCPYADVKVFRFPDFPENIRVEYDDSGYTNYVIKIGDRVLKYNESSLYYSYYVPDPENPDRWVCWVDYTYDDEGWEPEEYCYCYSMQDVLGTADLDFMMDRVLSNCEKTGQTDTICGFSAVEYTYMTEYEELLSYWYAEDLGYIVKCSTEYGSDWGFNRTVTGWDTSVTEFPIELPA